MLESSPQNNINKVEIKSETENMERPLELDATTLMKEKNCYFVHMMQVTKALDVSENNKSINTNKLTNVDKLDIFSQGEVISANQSDDGTIAKSLTEREIIGGAKNSKEDIDKAVDRPNGGYGKSYNEIVLKEPEVAGGFMKIDGEAYKNKISYEEESINYGSDGDEAVRKYGVLDLTNEKNGAVFDIPFSVLLEMKSRGPVFLLDENNQMLLVTKIDEKARKLSFSLKSNTPADIAEVYGGKKLNKYSKQEMLARLSSHNIKLD